MATGEPFDELGETNDSGDEFLLNVGEPLVATIEIRHDLLAMKPRQQLVDDERTRAVRLTRGERQP